MVKFEVLLKPVVFTESKRVVLFCGKRCPEKLSESEFVASCLDND